MTAASGFDQVAAVTAALPPPGSVKLRLAQARAAFRMELRKLLTGGSGVALTLFGGLPVAMVACWAIGFLLLMDEGEIGRELAGTANLSDVGQVFAMVFQGFSLAMIAFFACLMVFLNLVRRELRDKALHYDFLVPARREVVLAGKFAAGVAATFLVLGVSVTLSYLLLYAPFLRFAGAEVRRFFLAGPGFGHLAAYVGVTLLATLGYGAVFLALSVHAKNPILPALAVYGWEWLHFLLPPALKKLSVIHYLTALQPVPVSEGPFSLLAEKPDPLWSLVGLLVFAGVLLTLSMRRMRRMEVLYGED